MGTIAGIFFGIAFGGGAIGTLVTRTAKGIPHGAVFSRPPAAGR